MYETYHTLNDMDFLMIIEYSAIKITCPKSLLLKCVTHFFICNYDLSRVSNDFLMAGVGAKFIALCADISAFFCFPHLLFRSEITA